MNYTAAVVTISDKGARGERVDTSGPALVSILKQNDYEVVHTSIVSDEPSEIEKELIKLTDDLKLSLVLTTGGTGFSPRDNTPEVTLKIIERETRGIPELMRYESLKITKKACLSRAVAGIRKKTLIINLPGSEKAAKENFLAIIEPLEHGLLMLNGEGSANCGG